MTQLTIYLTLGTVFMSVALIAGLATSLVMASNNPELKRLRSVTTAQTIQLPEARSLATDSSSGQWNNITRLLGRSPKDVSRLRLRLAQANFDHPSAPVVYVLLELLLPIMCGAVPLLLLQGRTAWFGAAAAAIFAFFAPGLVVDQRLLKRRREIQNGLPDALDLLVVCIEAGSGLDQAIVKTSDELAITYPTLAQELRILTSEIRAGKPRIEAFRSLAQRTKVDDVRSLAAMLVQTDRFGTSIGQALRTHADDSREKRRQRAEERAQKLGVKMVFPLVFCFFPAFYVVTLGPAVIQFVREFL
jgi:tight adherence protein C